MNDSSSTRQRRGSLALLPLFTLALFSAFSGSAQAQDIQWQHDVQAAMKKAKAEQKLVLLHFTADWCRPCQAMETFVFPNLEVVRAVEENVIAVRVDADQEKSLVTEYSVSAVPYDVIITPGGRIVRKQKSPLNANGYRRMMASLSREVKGVEDNTGAAITQQLAAADNQFDFRPQQISEFQSFTPNSPSHTAPVTSNDSAKLARRGRVENPYFASARKAAASSAATAANKNSFAQTGQANMEKVQSSLAPSARTIANDFASASTNKVNPSAATKASNDLVVEAPRVSSDFQVFNGADLKKQAIEIAKSRVELNSQTDNQTNGPSLTAGDFAPAAPMTQPANEVTAAPKTVSATQQPPRFAAKIQPNVVHQDRFYRDPIVPAAVDGTRSAKPTSVAQQLLKPIKQYPAAATEKMKQVTGKVNEAFSAVAKRGNPLKPNFNQGTTKSVKPRTPAQQLTQQPIDERSSNPLAPIPTKNPQVKPEVSTQQLLANQQTMPRPPARQQLETQQTIAPNNRFAASAQTAGRAEQMLSQSVNQPKSRSTPSLRGKCPVSLLQHGKWVDGNSKFGCIHRDRLYVFASAEKLATFRADPDLFSPVLAGYDPVVFHETGKLVEGQPEHGVFMGQAPDQRILLFTDAATRDRFQKQPAAYLNSVRQAMKASGDSSSMIR